MDNDAARAHPGRFVWAACLILLLLEIPFVSYVTDDTYIYLQYARNLADGEGFRFTGDRETYGFTSPLWVLLLAGARGLGSDPLFAAKVLGLLFALGSLFAFASLARFLVPSPIGQAGALLAWTVNAWSLRWTLSGMETPAACFFILLGLALSYREKERGRPPTASAACLGLAALARPEALLLVALHPLSLLLRGWRGALRAVLIAACVEALVIVPWFFFAAARLGRILPNTFAAKGGGFGPGWDAAAQTLRQQILILGASDGLNILLLAAAALVTLARSRRSAFDWLREHAVAVGFLLLVPLIYAARGVVVVSRYLVPVMPLLPLLGFAGLDFMQGRSGISSFLRRGWLPAVVAALIVTQNILVLSLVELPSTQRFVARFRTSLIAMGEWLCANAPLDAVVAAPDVGALGYFSGRRVLDLFGIVSPEMQPYARKESLDRIVENLRFAEVARPEYLVDRHAAPDRFRDSKRWPRVLEPIFACEVGRLTLRRPVDYFYTLYRIHWGRYDSLMVGPGLMDRDHGAPVE